MYYILRTSVHAYQYLLIKRRTWTQTITCVFNAYQISSFLQLISQDESDVVFRATTGKWRAVLVEISRMHKTGRPVLVGTTSVEQSDALSEQLREAGIPHEVGLLNNLPCNSIFFRVEISLLGKLWSWSVSYMINLLHYYQLSQIWKDFDQCLRKGSQCQTRECGERSWNCSAEWSSCSSYNSNQYGWSWHRYNPWW